MIKQKEPGDEITALSIYAHTADNNFNPAKLKGPAHGLANQVFVLGTPHLSGLPKHFSIPALQGLLDKLAACRT